MIMRTATALLVTTMLTGAAFAQTATTPSTMSPAPATTTAAMSGQFVTDQPVGQFRASKVIGVNIFGPDDQRIGNINDVLLDGSGNIKTIVVGVGGFLGIGEKNVGIPWTAVQWVLTKPDATATTGSTTGMTATTTAPMTAGTSVAPVPTTAATGAGTAMATRSPAEQATYNGYPDHGKVTMTKADLQNAPTFRYYSDTHSSSGATNATPPATRQ